MSHNTEKWMRVLKSAFPNSKIQNLSGFHVLDTGESSITKLTGILNSINARIVKTSKPKSISFKLGDDVLTLVLPGGTIGDYSVKAKTGVIGDAEQIA